MKMLMIRDLSLTEELDRKTLKAVRGGIYRTPSQILAHDLTYLPATSDGRVLGSDGQLHTATGPLLGPVL